VWRGGYNSGKTNSINHTFLDLEAGINRVAIRSTRVPGRIAIRAESQGLKPASVSIDAGAFAASDDLGTDPPAVTPTTLPATAPQHSPAGFLVPARPKPTSAPAGMAGNFIKNYSYTGPTASIVHIEANVRDGRNIYVDRDYTFRSLPADLVGADWMQTADGDQGYSAADLVELAVKGGVVVTIAHDPRATIPGWLAEQFQPTDRTIEVNGHPMALFTRRVNQDTSLTLGSNHGGAPQASNMYVVFVR
jgi:beta-galactosidase